MARDIEDLIAWARSQGWEVRTTSDGYRHFYRPDGQWVVHHPATPSNPRRRLLDVAVAVRRNGLQWPAPSKKEQRSQRRKEGQ
jgi:hypothetical protein